MSKTFHRRLMLQSGLALGALIWLPRARSCEIMTSTLRVTHPWSRATAPGDDTAVLCMKFDEVTESDRLVRVHTPVASDAEMGGKDAKPGVDFAIPAGQETYLDDTGTYVRLLGLKFPLLPGRSYPLMLGFEKGGDTIATLSVDYPRFK